MKKLKLNKKHKALIAIITRIGILDARDCSDKDVVALEKLVMYGFIAKLDEHKYCTTEYHQYMQQLKPTLSYGQPGNRT